MKRKIIKIDEDKCNGCGLCIPNCHEGALQIIDGKARLVSESACDGLGACLGHCPQGAITIEKRDAEEFDETKAPAHRDHGHSACPSMKVIDSRKTRKAPKEGRGVSRGESELRQWPVQIMLVPPSAPYLKDADLLVAADCVPFAYPNFHEDFLKGKTLMVGCPKLDDIRYYKERLSQIFKDNSIKSVTYVHMEVPCCFGLIDAIKETIAGSKKQIPFEDINISIGGERIR